MAFLIFEHLHRWGYNDTGSTAAKEIQGIFQAMKAALDTNEDIQETEAQALKESLVKREQMSLTRLSDVRELWKGSKGTLNISEDRRTDSAFRLEARYRRELSHSDVTLTRMKPDRLVENGTVPSSPPKLGHRTARASLLSPGRSCTLLADVPSPSNAPRRTHRRRHEKGHRSV